jgi:NADH:ubiquinone oxidoreductase subunit D
MLVIQALCLELRVLYQILDKIPHTKHIVNFPFQTPIGIFGDSYDRYLLRIDEMFQSISIIQQAISLIPEGPHKNVDHKITPPLRQKIINDMESMIHHFKFYSEGIKVPTGEGYSAIESPKGEFGVYLAAHGFKTPRRCKIRAAGLPPLFTKFYDNKPFSCRCYYNYRYARHCFW